jgi:hypothetical protein
MNSSFLSRRAVILGSGAVLVGAATTQIAFGEGDPEAAPQGILGMPDAGTDAAAAPPTAPVDLEAQRQKFVSTLARKLGITSERLQQALDETVHDLGGVPPILVSGSPAGVLPLDSELDAIAKALGITTDELRKEWVNASLEDLAKAHNVDPNSVANAIATVRLANLGRSIVTQSMPQSVADQMRANVDKSVSALMRMKRGDTPAAPGLAPPLVLPSLPPGVPTP